MRSNIYLDANPYEVRVAVVEDGNLAELYVERKGSERIVGNIYKGVVKNVLPGMQAAFVDIGIERNAFLYAGDISVDAVDEELPEEDERAKCIPDIRKLVRVGQSIMVQVLKEPFGTKGARVTTNITLPGYKVVLLPKANYVGISRKIEDEEERTRLKTILEEIKPSHRGVIARSSALGADREELAQAVRQSEVLPPAECRLLALGLRSGSGDRVMEDIARRLGQAGEDALEDRVSRVEPALVGVTSVLVGVILLSVMLPLMHIMSAIG